SSRPGRSASGRRSITVVTPWRATCTQSSAAGWPALWTRDSGWRASIGGAAAAADVAVGCGAAGGSAAIATVASNGASRQVAANAMLGDMRACSCVACGHDSCHGCGPDGAPCCRPCVRHRPARYCRPRTRRLAMRPDVLPFRHDGTGTWSYLVLDPASGDAALVDPVLDYDAAAGRTGTQSAQALVDAVRGRGASVRWLLETHAHADHVSASHWLKATHFPDATLAIGAGIRTVQETFGPIFNLGDD